METIRGCHGRGAGPAVVGHTICQHIAITIDTLTDLYLCLAKNWDPSISIKMFTDIDSSA